MTKMCRLAALFAFAFLFACGQKADTGPALARVNDAPILLKDFQKEVSVASKRDPLMKLTPETLKEMLETSIDRKLMIQQAVKMGLSEDEKFLETIKAYWEQTLLRQLIDAKTKQWGEKLSVTDEEVKRHYEGMGYRVTALIAEVKTEAEAEGINEALQGGKDAALAKLAGPAYIEDAEFSDPLYNAFFQNEKEVRVYKHEGGYIVIRVVKKEAVKTPPMKAVSDKIRANLLEQKKKEALEDWIAEIKGSSRIEIDETLLEKAAP